MKKLQREELIASQQRRKPLSVVKQKKSSLTKKKLHIVNVKDLIMSDSVNIEDFPSIDFP